MTAREAALQMIDKSGIRQSAVADALGITPHTISRWRRIENAGVRPENVEAVAKLTGFELTWTDLNRTEWKFEARGEQQTGGNEMEKEEYRYEAHVKDGVRERFDRKTGRWEIYDESRGEWRKLGKEG